MPVSKGFWKRSLQIITAALMVFAVMFVAYAVEYAAVMEQYVIEDSVLLYIKHDGTDQEIEAHIGTDPTDGVSVESDFGGIPIVTWLLVDNSISINEGDRSKTKQILSDLVAGRSPNERFNLCTYHEDKLEILLQDSQNYTDLKDKIDAIEYKDQETFLTDVLDELLDIEKKRELPEFVRIVIVSDGVDNNPGGLTREELNQRLKDQNLPIYTLGCKTEKNDQILKEMFSLSRQTNGTNWTLSDMTDTLGVVRAMSGEELPICVKVPIPEKLRDGTAKGVQISFSDGTIAETQVLMPFGSITLEPNIESEHTNEYELDDVKTTRFAYAFLLFLIPCILVIVALALIVVFVLRKKKDKERIRVVDQEIVDQEVDETDIANIGSDSDTVLLVNDDSRLTLILMDCTDPNRHFECLLNNKVSIGRSPANQIVLDYEKSVSSVHCEIFIDGNTFRIRDMNSKNGTYVDGIRVGSVAEISNGSTIKLGRLKLLVEIR